MKYTPREPAEGINVSDTHPLAEAGTLFAGAAALFVAATLIIVFLVDILVGFISVERETRVFSSWLPDDVEMVATMSDEERHANALLQRLAAHWPETDYEFRLRIRDETQPNALALPGGLIFVTRGLMEDIDSENELAFVLAHEIGHYRNRDHLRQLGRAAALSIFFATVTSGGSTGFGFGISDLSTRGFDRKQESAADRFGLSLVQAEYGHVNDATRFFERLATQYGGDSPLGGFLDTHPQPIERMRDLRDYAREQQWPLQGKLTPWPPDETRQ